MSNAPVKISRFMGRLAYMPDGDYQWRSLFIPDGATVTVRGEEWQYNDRLAMWINTRLLGLQLLRPDSVQGSVITKAYLDDLHGEG